MSVKVTNEDFKKIYDKIYPIGSYYFSNNATSPASTIGGQWTQITNCFLYTVTSISSTNTQSSSTRSLSSNNITSHTHSYSHSHTGYSHTHTVSDNSHTHSITGHTHTGSAPNHTHLIQAIQMPQVNTTSSAEQTSGIGWPTYGMFASATSSSRHKNTYTTTPSTLQVANASLGTIGKAGATTSTSGGSGTSGSASIGTTGSAGNGSSFSIMPTYKGYYVWYRTG